MKKINATLTISAEAMKAVTAILALHPSLKLESLLESVLEARLTEATKERDWEHLQVISEDALDHQSRSFGRIMRQAGGINLDRRSRDLAPTQPRKPQRPRITISAPAGFSVGGNLRLTMAA